MGGLTPLGKGWVRAVDSGIASQVVFFFFSNHLQVLFFSLHEKQSHWKERKEKHSA